MTIIIDPASNNWIYDAGYICDRLVTHQMDFPCSYSVSHGLRGFIAYRRSKPNKESVSGSSLHTARSERFSRKKGQPVPEWVFASKNGWILSRVVFENALNHCLEKEKLRRIRVHDLRHTYATIRLMRGHNVGDVSYQLSHSSINVSAHWIPGQFKSEVDELDQVHPNAPKAHPANVT